MADETTAAAPTNSEAGSGRRRWIVGVDGSDASRHAALWAITHAPGRSDEVHLISSWNIPTATAMGAMSAMTVSTSFEALEASADAVVDELATDLERQTDVTIARSVGCGGAAAVLLDASADAALLVAGSRGRGGFARLVLGSTSTQCATHSSKPVAVIPSTATLVPTTSIVVAFDGSANSAAALHWAAAFAAPGSTIEAVSVWDPTPIALGMEQVAVPDSSDHARARADGHFADAMRTVHRDDVEVRHSFIEGRARPALADAASRADLLVMGARGYGAFSAAVLGSVSTWLLHHVERPMVVVPHADTPEA